MSGVLISTSVIWFCGRRQKPCCCALHFINHCFMWTRSEPPSPPPTPPPPSPLCCGRPLRPVYPAVRGLSGPDQLTCNYFGLFSFAGGQRGIPAKRGNREEGWTWSNPEACEKFSSTSCCSALHCITSTVHSCCKTIPVISIYYVMFIRSQY